MVADHIWGRVIVTAFALICAWQDIRSMSVSIYALAAGAASVAVAAAVMFITGMQKDLMPVVIAEKAAVTTIGILIGCLPGAVMIIFSLKTGQIGIGDGLYFMVIGAALGIKRTMVVILLASFVQVLICGGFLLKMIAESNRNGESRVSVGKDDDRSLFRSKLPFLPAAGIALLWLFVLG